MMTRDDVVMTKNQNFKIAQNCPTTVGYDIYRYSTSFVKVSDQLTEFYGH